MKALLAVLGIDVAGRPVEVGAETTDEGMRAATDAARQERDTLGGVVEVVATGLPPGFGSYAEKADRLDARLAFALMGIQAVKGVEIGDGSRSRAVAAPRRTTRSTPGSRVARTGREASRLASRTASRSSSARR